MKKATEAWLNAAQDDLALIEEIIHNDGLSHMVAFHAQQAIEKSFKSVLEEYVGNVPRIHTLETLLPKVANYVTFANEFDLLEDLDKLYTDARYPGDLGLLPYGKPTIAEAEAFFGLAQRVYTQVVVSIIKP